MKEARESEIEALDEQIRKLREMRRRWADGGDLSKEEKPRRAATLELLDGALQDLIKKRLELKGSRRDRYS